MRKWIFLTVNIFICGSMLGAGYSNVWPSVDFPRQGKLHSENIQDALQERKLAANVGGAPPVGTFFRFQRGNLINFKNIMKNVIPSYIQADLTNAPGGAFTTNGNVTSWSSGKLFTISNITEKVQIPSNFFDFTPFRSLNGLGGNTDDATVPDPYGFTNSFTQDGGSNFPGSRTNWYTTDYGWQGMRDCLDIMIWTIETGTFSGAPDFDSGNQNSTNGFAVVKTLVTDNYAIVGTNALAKGRTFSQLEGVDANAFGRAISDSLRPVVTNLNTNFTHVVNFYGYTTNNQPGVGETNTFDANGIPFTFDTTTRFDSATESSSSSITGLLVGITTVPTFPSNPTNGGKTVRGADFFLDGFDVVIKWTESGTGFQFVE